MISKRKKTAAAAFDRAACAYETAAVIQHTVGCRLAERIGQLDLPAYPAVLEVGCGTCLFSRAALGYLNPSLWIATDLSPVMVARCRDYVGSDRRFLFICMDGEAPAITMGSGFDLICANLVMQWFDDLAGALGRLARLIRAGGWLAFTTLAAGTFIEWVETHHQLGLVAGTPSYPDTATLADQWPPGGQGTIAGEMIRHTYSDAHAFVATLKTIGAHATDRRPLAPGAFRQVLRTFGVGGPVAVSYHVVYGLWRRDGAGCVS
ncbi:Biotin synthesis protein BioC [invertebrate metagenome]|uniref:Biotin synthesis protein BioC n=1 Tax=invertebrate metagenome TaxID=1711999 RepID=A0A484H6R5_9ZZZZ